MPRMHLSRASTENSVVGNTNHRTDPDAKHRNLGYPPRLCPKSLVMG